jgi:hypothetical protein
MTFDAYSWCWWKAITLATLRATAKLGPQLGLEDLTLLITSLRATGMPVAMHLEGTPRNLDPGVNSIAYRIVQEGLTNVLACTPPQVSVAGPELGSSGPVCACCGSGHGGCAAWRSPEKVTKLSRSPWITERGR